MNSKSAHAQLKKINAQRNAIGIGGYKNSRRSKNEQHEKFNEAMNEMNKISDDERMKNV